VKKLKIGVNKIIDKSSKQQLIQAKEFEELTKGLAQTITSVKSEMNN
jgi:hypothetical protein